MGAQHQLSRQLAYSAGRAKGEHARVGRRAAPSFRGEDGAAAVIVVRSASCSPSGLRVNWSPGAQTWPFPSEPAAALSAITAQCQVGPVRQRPRRLDSGHRGDRPRGTGSPRSAARSRADGQDAQAAARMSSAAGRTAHRQILSRTLDPQGCYGNSAGGRPDAVSRSNSCRAGLTEVSLRCWHPHVRDMQHLERNGDPERRVVPVRGYSEQANDQTCLPGGEV